MSAENEAHYWPFPPPEPPAPFPRARRRPRPPGAADRVRGLTRRQNEFCEAYVATGNAADAARRAGYSERAARFHGHRLLKDARVQARLAALRTALADKIDPGLILGRLENLYRLAERDGGYRAAARILVLIGRMIGVDYNGGAIYLRSPDLQPEPRLPSATEASRAWLAEHGPSPNVYRGYVDAQGTDGPNGSAPNAQDPYDFGSK